MDGENLSLAEALCLGGFVDGEYHGIDVRQHFHGSRARRDSRFSLCLGACKLADAELHSLHLGRGDRFGAQKKPSEWA